MDSQSKPTDQPTPVKKLGHRYQKGHPYHPLKHAVSHLSVKKQRAAQVKTLGNMIAQMAEQFEAGKPVDPVAYATLINTYRRVQAEL